MKIKLCLYGVIVCIIYYIYNITIYGLPNTHWTIQYIVLDAEPYN